MTKTQSDLFSVRDRTALVVGGTRGIGRAIAWRLAEAGAYVVATYVRQEAEAQRLTREAAAIGLSVEVVRADVTTSKGMDLLLEGSWVESTSIVIFATATGVHKPLDDLTLRHWDWTFNLNARAFFELVRRIGPRMRRGSSIVALSSEGG